MDKMRVRGTVSLRNTGFVTQTPQTRQIPDIDCHFSATSFSLLVIRATIPGYAHS